METSEIKMDNKRKHLEFIQSVISRMNTNSFLIKGWTVTLVSGICALAGKDSNTKLLHITFIVIPAFWFLDGFYISTERRYRDLYVEVAAKSNDDEINFSMDASACNHHSRTWLGGVFSKTLILFYGFLIAMVIIVKLLLG